MRQIRRGVFETNSSSSHSISICKWKAPKEFDIPKDTTLVVDGLINRSEITDQVGKLNYITVMLVSLLDREVDYALQEKMNQKEVFNTNRFIWLKELIKEECNTVIEFSSTRTCFPYMQTTYDDNNSMSEIFECNVHNESEMKKRMKEIIFTRDIVIEDKENDY